MKAGRVVAVAAVAVAGVFVFAFARDYWLEYQFAGSSIGDSEAQILALVGEPTVRETPGQPYLRYTAKPCVAPCAQRWWWEKKGLLGLKVWASTFDENGKVIRGDRYESPRAGSDG